MKFISFVGPILLSSIYSGLAFGECADLSGKWALDSCSVGESDIGDSKFKIIQQSACSVIEVRHSNAEGRSYLNVAYKFGVDRSIFSSGGSPYPGSGEIDYTDVTHGKWIDGGQTVLIEKAKVMVFVGSKTPEEWKPSGYSSLIRFTLVNDSLEIQEKRAEFGDSNMKNSICKYLKAQ